MAGEEGKPLRRIAEAFEGLADTVSAKTAAVEVAPFSRACSRVSVLFGCLGIAFKFAEMDYVSKVEDLSEASKSISTLHSLLDLDVEKNCVRQAGSHSRNLLRVKRGLDMVKVLFEQILASEGNSLKDPASVAYTKVFAPHHGWAIRKAVAAGMYALPTKAQLLKKLNEDEASAKVQMQNYISASTPVILYIEELFLSRNLGSHSVGRTHCVKLVHRLYPEVDPDLNPDHVPHMLKKCPDPIPDPKAVQYVRNDRGTPMKLDNNYYRNILDNKGLLQVDHQLAYDKRTRPFVKKMAKNQDYFFKEFSRAITILSENNPITGDEGEIRKQCNVVNKHH